MEERVDERARLAALRSYEVLDSESEPAIDAVVRLAATACGVPYAAVTLVDERRVWLLSKVGLEICELPRERSFSEHTIRRTGVFEVVDAREDPRFSDAPLVLGPPYVRFHAGAPIVDTDGFGLGALSIFDAEPRELTRAQRELLTGLSLIVNRLLVARASDAKKRRAEEEARREERVLAVAAEVAGIGYWRIDVSAQTLEWSEQVYRIHGVSPDTYRPSIETAVQAYHPDDQGRVSDVVARAMSTGTPFDFDLRIVRPSGEVRFVRSAGRAELDAQGRCVQVFGVFQDNTEREQLRVGLIRTERLATTGAMASGLGHEINNPLAYALANLDMAIPEVKAAALGPSPGRMGEVLAMLGEARDGAERIRKIVRGLRAFAREESDLAPTDVGPSIEISIDLVRHRFREAVTLKTELENVPPVLASESRIAQIVVNLLVHAAQSFTTPNPETNHVHLRSRATPSGVIIEVEDNAPAIAKEAVPSIFDPFFVAGGATSGLGLVICHNVVGELGGQISCDSEVGRGTRFRVLLPIAHRPLSTAPPPPRPDPRPVRHRILIVDDEETILRALIRLLKRDHDVVGVSRPDEALRRFQAGERFDVVFCDLTMPELAGDELYRAVGAFAPDQAARFVFMSGGVSDEAVRAFLASIPNEQLEKPFDVPTLTAMARRVAALHA